MITRKSSACFELDNPSSDPFERHDVKVIFASLEYEGSTEVVFELIEKMSFEVNINEET